MRFAMRTKEDGGRVLLRSLSIFFVSALSLWLVFRSLTIASPLVYLWPFAAVQLGLLIPVWSSRRSRGTGICAGLLGLYVGGLVVGLPPWFTLALGFVTAVDVWIVATILSKNVRGFEDLKRRQNLMLFAIAAAVAPIATGLLLATPLAAYLHQPLLKASVAMILSDSLSIGVIVPPMLYLLTGEYRTFRKLRPHLLWGSAAGALFLVVAVSTFWQTSQPFLFMVFPPMVLMAIAMGLEGSVFVSVTLVVIGMVATVHGHGPLMLSRAATAQDRLVILELFLWMSMATSLPIGAMLDERRRAEKAAEEAQSVYQIVLENAEDMIVLSSMNGDRRYVSPASQRLTGWTPEEFLALDRLETFHPEDRDVARLVMESMTSGKGEHIFHYRMAQKDGSWRWVEAAARAYFDGETGVVRGYVGTVRDISEFKDAEAALLFEREKLSKDNERIEMLARTDALTLLPNRRAFDETLRTQMTFARQGKRVALLMVDVDYFKLYNDVYGHQEGDLCLRRIGDALQSQAARGDDFVARWGGEEFGVLLPGADLAGAQVVADGILEAVRGLQIEHKGSPRGICTVSIGVAALDAKSVEDPALWVQQADKALYSSKRTGKDRMTLAVAVAQVA